MKEIRKLNKILLKATPLITAVLLLTLLAIPVRADGGGHLWFYSVDPGTLNPPDPLPDPQIYDPNYVGVSSDTWTTESIVPTGDWETPFSIWLGCAQFESLKTILVISINDAAFAAIDTIKVNGLTLGTWDTDPDDFPLPPHGVANSAEWYGYANFTGLTPADLYSPPGTPYKTEITIDIDLKPDADVSEAKIHFDALGYTETGARIFSPFSHDLNFVVPEPATVLAAASSMLALGTYAYKRRKQ